MDAITKKQKAIEYYKTIFPKRIMDGITMDVDENGEFFPDYYWLLNNIVLFHKICRSVCEPAVEFKLGWFFEFYCDYLKEIIEKRNKYLIINVSPGHGKCFGKGTLIRMFDGSKKAVENIQEGDLIMGDDSTPRKVLGTTRGQEEMFRITCKDGSSFVCNGSHILVLEKTNYDTNRKFVRRYTEKETKISVFDYIKQTDNFKKRNKLKKAKVFYNERKVTIDPYVLGYWLGDGSSSDNRISGHKDDLKILEKYLKKIGYNIGKISFKKTNQNAEQFGIIGPEKCYIRRQLKKYNLLNNKHIPEDFLINSEENRLKLFAGLLDSDGNANKYDNSLEFANKNEVLIDNVIELARSLGFYVTKYKKIVKQTTYYRLRIVGDFKSIPCLYERKTKVMGRMNRISPLLQYFKVESLGIGDYYGFELDGNHKFLLDDFTVSHNSSCLMSFVCLYLGFYPHTRFLIVSGTEKVREDYLKNIKEILNSPYYQQLFPQVKIDKNEKNNEDGFFLEKFFYKGEEEGGGRVVVSSILANKTGSNSDFSLFDDPVDYDRYKTEGENYLVKVNGIVGGTITRDRGLLGNEAPFLLCMQRIAANDPTGHLLGMSSSKKWKHIKVPAKVINGKDLYFNNKTQQESLGKYFVSPYRKWFVPNGQFVFPEKFNESRFEFLRDMINNDIDFQWQMFQECESSDNKIFLINCLNHYKNEDLANVDFQARVLSIDSSNGGNDYQSMQLWGFTTFDNPISKRKEIKSYLLECYLSQKKTPLFVQDAIDWYIEYQPDYIIIEEKSSGFEVINEFEIMIYGGLLDKKDPRKNKKVICFNPKLSKEDRARSCSTEINNSRTFFPEDYKKITILDKKQVYVIKEIERELDVFPSKNDRVHDDAVDALSQAINWARTYFNKNKERRVNISYV